MTEDFGAMKARRDAAAELVRRSERDLGETRGSAALGGRSRTILIELERKLRTERLDLAALDARLAAAAARA
ncbi:hypothetical protein [Methylocella sp.]|uniref:hypothetical protein n=1 Tax=Methylocella sp. TaxID=1978226 RepID=UPI0035B37C21